MARPLPQRGEVWIADLGYAAKRRPCLILSVPIEDHDRVLATYVPATTSRLGSRFEVELNVRFMHQAGVFDPQGIGSIPYAKLEKRIGELTSEQLQVVEHSVKSWLGLVPVTDQSK